MVNGSVFVATSHYYSGKKIYGQTNPLSGQYKFVQESEDIEAGVISSLTLFNDNTYRFDQNPFCPKGLFIVFHYS